MSWRRVKEARWTSVRGEHYDPSVHRDPTTSARHLLPTSPIRGALIAGFAIVLSLWALSGYGFVRRLRDLEQRTAAEQQAALRGERVLSTVRTNVLLGSIYLRDALIDNRPRTADYYRDQLNDLRGDVERVLPAYMVEVTSDEERRLWSELQSELQEYWRSRELVFSPAAPLNTSEAASVLRRRVVPSRETILQIIDRITDLQGLAQRRHEEEVSQLFTDLRRRLLLIGSTAIVLGIAVAMFATRHVTALEQENRRQRLGERRARQELERLSARLVTVQEEERRSLARELHDEVGQALTAIKMDVAVALRGAQVGSREKSSLEDARAIAEDTLQGVRDLSQLLHPSMLDDFGLPETVSSYLRGFEKRTGINVELRQNGMRERLTPEAEVCIYRITQEALTNVARHSGARKVHVIMAQSPSTLELVVEDDGRGLTSEATPNASSGGLGVIGMRERAQALGGTFALQSERGMGTRLTVQIPVRPVTSGSGTPEALAG